MLVVELDATGCRGRFVEFGQILMRTKQVGCRFGTPEKGAEAGEGEFRTTFRIVKPREDEGQPVPEVAVATSADSIGELSESVG